MGFLNERSYTPHYDQIYLTIQSLTIESLAQRSGLTAEEYNRLINSQFIDEIIHLILKGLKNLCKSQVK